MQNATRLSDVSHYLFIFAPGNTGRVRVRLETARHEFAVTQQCNAKTLALDDERGMCLGQVQAPAELHQARLFDQTQHVGKRRAAIVARVVVGQGHDIEVALEDRQHAWMSAKGVVLVASRASGGNDALQIDNTDIGALEKISKVGKRVPAA